MAEKSDEKKRPFVPKPHLTSNLRTHEGLKNLKAKLMGKV